MKTQLSTFFFVLFTIMTANGIKYHKTFLTQTYTGITPTQENINVLGKAADYAVLAGSTTTNSGATTVVGSIGVYPGITMSGTEVKLVDGEKHAGDPYSLAAQGDLLTGFNNIALLTGATNKSGTYLDGLTLPPGLYKFDLDCFLNAGSLTLDGQGDANAKWVFQIGTTLITEVDTSVHMINNGSALNVYWQVGTSATMKTNAVMVGNIMAAASISFGTGASLKGRALAMGGAVTMLGNVIEVKP